MISTPHLTHAPITLPPFNDSAGSTPERGVSHFPLGAAKPRNIAKPSACRCVPRLSEQDGDLLRFNWIADKDGYACANGSFAHRLVAQRMEGRVLGRWELVDHKNGVRLDCRRENLRLTDSVGNHQNIPRNKWSGTTFHKKSGKWQAAVKHHGRSIHCGIFDSRDDAARVAAEKRKELGFLSREEVAQ